MGTDITFLVDGPADSARTLFAEAEGVVRGLETILSRFLPNSELARLNRSGHARVHADLRCVTQLAIDARTDTDGRFDPTLCEAVVAAGYDRSFDDVPRDVGATTPPVSHSGQVAVDDVAGTITLGRKVSLDLGGIAKGYAAEMAAELLAEAGPCLVNAGGDIATRGVPTDGSWAVGVATADGEVTIGLTRGGLATSGRDRRRWQSDGEERHHIIDPNTMLPSQSDILRITVLAPTAVAAETYATALFMVGADDAIAEAHSLGLTTIVVTDTGETLTTGIAA